ncbi:MAG TPA: glycosyltransferase family 39 protein [Flavipsychrobacter sp.]
MGNNHKNAIIRSCFYIAWIVVSLLQANLTELLADEAYYWKYAQNLQWGYFDHPPVVAVLIKPGYWLSQNELGIRLLFVLSSALMIYVLEQLVRPKNLKLFYLSVASIGAFHFLGFLALPDMPLLLFTATFLYLYKQYLQKDSWGISILLALNATLLLLSKYHGILVIGFAVLSNLQLLKRKTFWLVALLSLNLFIPHIQWQAAHDFPSIRYHLYERSAEPYQIDFTLNYLLSVVLMFSPVVGIVFAWHTLKKKVGNDFERALKWMTAGTLIFFFLMTFKGRGEGNWVAFALIPSFITGYRYCEQRDWFPKFTRNSFVISILLIALLRVYLVYDFLPDNKVFAYAKATLHHTKQWAKDIQQQAGDKPVAFMNKYQYAAWYEFYTGHKAISLNNRMGRKNQYNIWKDEQNIQGQTIMLVPNYDAQGMEQFNSAKGAFQYAYIDNFRSASHIRIVPLQKELQLMPGEVNEVSFTLTSTDSAWTLEGNPGIAAVVHSMLFKKEKLIKDQSKEFYVQDDMVNSGELYTVSVQAPEERGVYELYLDIAMGWLPPAINGEKITIEVK